jgi:hypothetical protein
LPEVRPTGAGKRTPTAPDRPTSAIDHGVLVFKQHFISLRVLGSLCVG